MAYLQGHKFKKTIKLAPDAVVYLNGQKELQLSQDIKLTGVATEAFTNDVLTVQTQASLHAVPGTANITIANPTHSRNYFRKDGSLIFKPRQEIHIYMKGRFLSSKGDKVAPKFYQVFHGVINTAEDTYKDGVHTITVNCSDMLQWWKDMLINVSPAIRNSFGLSPQAGFSHLLAGKNPYEIIVMLTQLVNFGAYHPENIQTRERFIGASSEGLSKLKKVDLNKSVLDYWTERFKDIVNKLKIFGYSGDPLNFKVTKESNGNIKKIAQVGIKKTPVKNEPLHAKETKGLTAQEQEDQTKKILAEKIVNYRNTPLEDTLINNFHEFGTIGTSQVFTSTIMSLLDVAIATKDFIGYEFFQDVTGEIMFKPPFYNLNTKNSRASVISNEDIFDWNFTETDEVCTMMHVKGDMTSAFKLNFDFVPEGFFTDFRLAEQFGYRYRQITQTGLLNADMCLLYARSEMDRVNAERFNGQLTLIGRPELRLGMPVFIEPKDAYYYVTSINHSFTFGGTFQTTLQLGAARKRLRDPITGEILKNQILSFDSTRTAIKEKEVTDSDGANPAYEQNAEGQKKETEEKKVIDGILTEAKVLRSNTAGTYVQKTYAGNLNNVPPDFIFDNQILSDKDGYEVIGSLNYGRSFSLDASGRLINQTGGAPLQNSSITIAEIRPADTKTEEQKLSKARSADDEMQGSDAESKDTRASAIASIGKNYNRGN